MHMLVPVLISNVPNVSELVCICDLYLLESALSVFTAYYFIHNKYFDILYSNCIWY